MQAFLPSALLTGASALPSANPPLPSARAAQPNADNTFSRQLEQSRQRAQDSARAAPQPLAVKPVGPPPPVPSAAPAPPTIRQNHTAETHRHDAQHAASSRGPRKSEAAARTDSARAEAEAKVETRQARDAASTEAAAHAGPADPAAPGVPPASLPTDPAAVPAEAALARVPGADGSVPETSVHGVPGLGTPRVETRNAAPDAADDAAGDAANGATPLTAMPEATLVATHSAAGSSSALPLSAAAARDAREATVPDTGARNEPSWQHAQAAAALAEGLVIGCEGEAPDRSHAASVIDSTDGSFATAGLAGPGGPAAAHASARASDVAQASLATPTTSPEFRAALGAQVSIFARAGVQQAELHLNPADMGPVSIQIVLDGQQAQVNFGADSALTRQLIESGMPELAGALRDAGLTLTGGGVSQHAGGQRQDGNGNGSAGGGGSNLPSGTATDGATDAQAEQTRRSVIRTAQGGVDLYA